MQAQEAAVLGYLVKALMAPAALFLAKLITGAAEAAAAPLANLLLFLVVALTTG
jgi:hypothetical protein